MWSHSMAVLGKKNKRKNVHDVYRQEPHAKFVRSLISCQKYFYGPPSMGLMGLVVLDEWPAWREAYSSQAYGHLLCLQNRTWTPVGQDLNPSLRVGSEFPISSLVLFAREFASHMHSPSASHLASLISGLCWCFIVSVQYGSSSYTSPSSMLSTPPFPRRSSLVVFLMRVAISVATLGCLF